MVMKVIIVMMMRIIMKIMNSSSCLRVLPIITQLINDFAVCKHCSGTVTCLEAVARRCSVKKVFLAISQNSQDNVYAIASFLKKKKNV